MISDKLPLNAPDLFTSDVWGERRYKTESSLVVNNGLEASVQNPLPTDGDSVYTKDIWVEESDITGWTGNVTDLFDNLHTIIINESETNPKSIFIHFKRTIVSNTIGLGAFTGNFSNVRIGIFNSGGIETIVYDNSTDNNKETSQTIPIPVTAGFNAIKLYFHTDDPVSVSNLVILKSNNTVARIQGVRDDGLVGNLTLSNSDRLRIVSQPYTYAVAEGDLPGHYGLLKFGTRTLVAAGVPSVIWEGPTAIYPYLDAAEFLKISSSSINDTSTGTGVRYLKLHGLDGSYTEQTETILTNGTGVVTTTKAFRRIFRIESITCGTLYTNAGTITVTNNAGTSVLAVINPSDGQTLMSMWTVPLGKTAYIVKGSCSTDSNKGARISIFIRKLDGGILYPWQIKYRGYIFSGGQEIPLEIPYVIPEKTDIEMRVLTPGSAGTTSVGGTFELWYEDN